MRCPRLNTKQKKELRILIKDNNSSSKEIKRAQAIIMLDKQLDIEIITEMTNYGRRQIFDIRRKYLNKGLKAIEDPARKNPKELLNKQQRQEIIKIVSTKTPEDMGFRSSYWTTAILGEFIKRRYKVKYKSRTSIYLIFRQAKFTYHKPGRIYENRDEQEVLKWRKKAQKKIKQSWQEKETVILCEDEMILSTQTTFQKIWLPANEYPKIEVSNTRKNKSIYGFLNIKTGQEHAFKTEKQNMYITEKILKKIRKIYSTQKLLILWDGAGWHRGSVVQKFIEKDQNIETVYFPRYAPEENPQEHVWKKGRNEITDNKFIENIDDATDDFVKYLNKTSFCYSLLGFSAFLE